MTSDCDPFRVPHSVRTRSRAARRRLLCRSMVNHGFGASGREPAFYGFPCDAFAMSVIVELALPSQEFELGRILGLNGGASVVLETMVPLGERTVPFFRVHGGVNGFKESVSQHDAVNQINVVSTHDGEVLYALDWDISDQTFFDVVLSTGANLLEGQGVGDSWTFELRFGSHETLSEFQTGCTDHDIPIEIRRLYNPTKPEAGPWYGLSPPQRIALTRAVEAGYYSIPRQTSTKSLAEEFDITDQALTERLRRGIRNLVSNTLHMADQTE